MADRERAVRLAIVDDDAVVVPSSPSRTSTLSRTGPRYSDFVRDSGARDVICSWNLNRDLIEEAEAGGASGYLSKMLTGPAIVAAPERIMAGETVILTGDDETSVGGAGGLAVPGSGAVAARGRGLALIPDRRAAEPTRVTDMPLFPTGASGIIAPPKPCRA